MGLLEGDEEDDFPLIDHPPPGAPKAGSGEMNRARDLQHLDVAAGRQPVREARPTVSRAAEVSTSPPLTATLVTQPATAIAPESDVMMAWRSFQGQTGAADAQFHLFMAGWAACDALRPVYKKGE